jgi:hypothetical protein
LNFIRFKQLEEANSKLVELPTELAILREVTGIQFENFKNEVGTFCARVRKLREQVSGVDDAQLNCLKEFIEGAFGCIAKLAEHEARLESWKAKLAEHFCEDSSNFKLEECFAILERFLEKIKNILNVHYLSDFF